MDKYLITSLLMTLEASPPNYIEFYSLLFYAPTFHGAIMTIITNDTPSGGLMVDYYSRKLINCTSPIAIRLLL